MFSKTPQDEKPKGHDNSNSRRHSLPTSLLAQSGTGRTGPIPIPGFPPSARRRITNLSSPDCSTFTPSFDTKPYRRGARRYSTHERERSTSHDNNHWHRRKSSPSDDDDTRFPRSRGRSPSRKTNHFPPGLQARSPSQQDTSKHLAETLTTKIGHLRDTIAALRDENRRQIGRAHV